MTQRAEEYPFVPVPYYCEENVWMFLSARASARNGVQSHDESFAVFVSNAERSVPFMRQKNSGGEPVVFWDYHVVALARDGGKALVTDFNCDLDEPLDASLWLDASFGSFAYPEEFQPSFKVIDCADYLARFSSDRSHMRNPDGSFTAPPPRWPCIGTGMNLDRFIDMKDRTYGKVMSLKEFSIFIRAVIRRQ